MYNYVVIKYIYIEEITMKIKLIVISVLAGVIIYQDSFAGRQKRSYTRQRHVRVEQKLPKKRNNQPATYKADSISCSDTVCCITGCAGGLFLTYSYGEALSAVVAGMLLGGAGGLIANYMVSKKKKNR